MKTAHKVLIISAGVLVLLGGVVWAFFALKQDDLPDDSNGLSEGEAVKDSESDKEQDNDEFAVNIETVDDDGWVGIDSSIALDELGVPHISYIDATNGDLKHAVKNNDGWESDVSLVLDEDDIPHMTFKVESEAAMGDGVEVDDLEENGEMERDGPEDNDLMYAVKRDGSWETTLVDAETVVGGDTGIDVDSKGHPHIGYNDYGNESKMYAGFNGEEWVTQVAAEDTGACEGTRIVVGNNDELYLAYNKCVEAEDGDDLDWDTDEDEGLFIAKNNGSKWESKRICLMGIFMLCLGIF